ncbi:hypothetical protein L1049_014038 [Liquidambar formosana]|uniref:Histidine-containing phosphotransfer protein n=1 Tax=Liquidambar formosana TaxID=63359 RepID=A0AAP0RLK9_LIQFO
MCTNASSNIQDTIGLDCATVTSIIPTGVVNDQFSKIQALKSAEERDGVVQFINTYCVEVEAILWELRSYIDVPEVDFSRLGVQARKIEEKSSCIGAEHVRLACADVIQSCDEKHKENLSRALSWMKYEFAHTRNKLETFAQMEQRIIRVESRQQK